MQPREAVPFTAGCVMGSVSPPLVNPINIYQREKGSDVGPWEVSGHVAGEPYVLCPVQGAVDALLTFFLQTCLMTCPQFVPAHAIYGQVQTIYLPIPPYTVVGNYWYFRLVKWVW